MSTSPRVAAVVLAGGAARRFGADKLPADIGGLTLLDRAVGGLPADWTVILVGPSRPLSRPAIVVRERPAGGGPAAGLVAGMAEAAAIGATMVVTLPGDAPNGGAAARLLVDRMDEPDQPDAVVGVDDGGVDQPLQLAVRGSALDRLASWPDASGLSARRLLAALEPAQRLRLPAALTVDVDTPEDLHRL